MLKLDLQQAESYVANTPAARWDNYTIVVFAKNPRAFTNRSGVFHNGSWGFEKRFDVNTDGMWTVSESGRSTRKNY